MLYIIYYMLYVTCYILYIICYMLYVIYYILYIICYILYIIHYILYIIYYILYIIIVITRNRQYHIRNYQCHILMSFNSSPWDTSWLLILYISKFGSDTVCSFNILYLYLLIFTSNELIPGFLHCVFSRTHPRPQVYLKCDITPSLSTSPSS